MNKNRLEAFSDGVFSTISTLLVPGIKIPDVDGAHLNQALVLILPNPVIRKRLRSPFEEGD